MYIYNGITLYIARYLENVASGKLEEIVLTGVLDAVNSY